LLDHLNWGYDFECKIYSSEKKREKNIKKN